MDGLCFEDKNEIRGRNKYENRIIKKHFINCVKNHKCTRKSSTNSNKKRAYRKSFRNTVKGLNFKQKIAYCKQNPEISNFVNVEYQFNDNEDNLVLSNYGENISNNLTEEDIYMQNNMNGWQCDECTFLNIESTLYCEMCNKCNPLCLSLNNASIQEYVDSNDNYDYMKNEDYYETKNIYNYDEDDFDNNVQYILFQTIDNEDNKIDYNVDDNIDCLVRNGYFSSYVIVNHDKSEDDDYYENMCKKNKKNSKTVSFKEYWLTMKQYNKKIHDNYEKIVKKNTKKFECESIKNTDNKEHTSLSEIFKKFPLLKDHLTSLYNLTSSFKIKRKLIIREEWLHRFYRERCCKQITTVFHGTNNKNDPSILKQGLLVGGTKGIPVTHGSSYGVGVYCSPIVQIASQYAIGSIYACLVYGASRHGNIWVAPDETHILPCFLMSYDGAWPSHLQNFSENNILLKFVTNFKPLNVKSIHRKWQRKWFSKYANI